MGTKLHSKRIKNVKSFPGHLGPLGGADLRFRSPQPDTSSTIQANTHTFSQKQAVKTETFAAQHLQEIRQY